MGNIPSQNVGYELNDCTFLKDNMLPKNDFIGPSKCCFVQRNKSESVSVLLSHKVRLCFPESPEEDSRRPKPAKHIYPRTSRTMPETERWLKPISSADRTHPTAWVRWGPQSRQQTDLQSVSAMPLTNWVPSASFLTSPCFSLHLIYKMEITMDPPQRIKWVNNCA